MNLKSIIFFLAFVPQSVCPAGGYATQSSTIVIRFALAVAFTDAVCACLALRVVNLLRSPLMARRVRRVGGVVFACSGLAAVALG